MMLSHTIQPANHLRNSITMKLRTIATPKPASSNFQFYGYIFLYVLHVLEEVAEIATRKGAAHACTGIVAGLTIEEIEDCTGGNTHSVNRGGRWIAKDSRWSSSHRRSTVAVDGKDIGTAGHDTVRQAGDC